MTSIFISVAGISSILNSYFIQYAACMKGESGSVVIQ